MKKLLCVFLALLMMLCVFAGCNKTLIDTTYSFDRAIVSLPDGTVVNGKVQAWTDYEDGDQIQVKIDGAIYLVHSSKIVLINDAE